MHYHALLRITVQVSVSVYLMSSHRSSCPLKSIQNVPAAVSHQPTALWKQFVIPTTLDHRFTCKFILLSPPSM